MADNNTNTFDFLCQAGESKVLQAYQESMEHVSGRSVYRTVSDCHPYYRFCADAVFRSAMGKDSQNLADGGASSERSSESFQEQ